MATMRDVYLTALPKAVAYPDLLQSLERWLAKLGLDVEACVQELLQDLSGGVTMDPGLLKYLAGFVAP